MNVFTLALLCASSLFSANALAQWQWVDAQGRKVYSDLPPPVQVPVERIIKQPGIAKAPAAAQAAPQTASPAAAQPVHRGSGVDAQLQARKTAEEAEQARLEQAQADAQEKKRAQARQDNCARAKAAQAALTDGRLLSHTNAQGERVFMDDAARAAERQRAQNTITSDCGPASAPRPQ
ncbi:DUF4124 domain-containing protein [Pantoea sp. 18069]|uniref:DUF4124 domain-containing protein n=1 Tax=Pantoea sp. 18069 TaxID=2681415 RepID=UPI001356AAE4|nr:DUF4124 domain-containing protein [Pantoea sp. 18069]